MGKTKLTLIIILNKGNSASIDCVWRQDETQQVLRCRYGPRILSRQSSRDRYVVLVGDSSVVFQVILLQARRMSKLWCCG